MKFTLAFSESNALTTPAPTPAAPPVTKNTLSTIFTDRSKFVAMVIISKLSSLQRYINKLERHLVMNFNNIILVFVPRWDNTLTMHSVYLLIPERNRCNTPLIRILSLDTNYFVVVSCNDVIHNHLLTIMFVHTNRLVSEANGRLSRRCWKAVADLHICRL